jgi:amino acid adenylation domain-containing protein
MQQVNIQEWFSATVDKYPDRIAIDYLYRRMTYAELEDGANNLANYLIEKGMEKGARVAVLADNSIEVITALIAILKAGGVFVPLDPRLPKLRLQAIVAEAEPQWFLIEAKFLSALNEAMTSTTLQTEVITFDYGDVYDKPPGSLVHHDDYPLYMNTRKVLVPMSPDDICYIYFTSGSLGKPKGIAGRLKGIDHFIRWEIQALGITDGPRVSQLTAPTFDAFLRDVFLPLCSGGTICVPDNEDTVLNGRKLVTWIEDQQINLIHCVPSLFRSILSQDTGPAYFLALRHVLLSGEPLLPADVEKWTSRYGDRVQLVNLYGPTETTMTKFAYFVQPGDQDRRFIPIGKPIEGTRALVLDAKGRACAPGAVGEIYIRTPYRALGYYNQPELTKEVFVQNPFRDDPNDIVYKTGDLGRILDDGNFEFLGRKDQQVKIRGVRIELREIEDLLQRHASVENAAVVDLEDVSNNKYLCAYVVLKKGTDAGVLREFLAQNLPAYMVPSAIVVIDELPLTTSGKLDRRALPTPAEAHAKGQKDFVGPRTPVEESVADMMCQLLGVERIGINDNFFELGGHSLLATQLLSRVRTILDVEVPLRALFEAPTVAGLALAITQLDIEKQDADEMARMIEEIKQLSEEALEFTLQGEMQDARQKESQ